MQNISTEYLNRAETWMLITTLAYFLMNGAQVFETAVIVPKWTAAPPLSLQMFKQPHAIDLKWFWIIMHSLHEITFILALVFCWQLSIGNTLLVLFILHFAVRIWTLVYFAPKIIAFQQSVNGGIQIDELAQQVQRWKKLNYLRVAVFMILSLVMPVLYLQLHQHS